MAATTDKLSTLHGRLADTMNDALEAEIERIEVTKRLLALDLTELDEATAKIVTGTLTLAPTARVDNGLLKTISSFLKDNNITTDLDGGDTTDETAAALERMQATRRKVSLPTDMLN